MASADQEEQKTSIDDTVPQLHFVYDLPFVSQRKLEIMKVVAKHSVFAPQTVTEQLRSQFDFLEEKHELHALFQSFVKQYTLIKDGVPLNSGNVIKRAIERAKIESQLEHTKTSTPAHGAYSDSVPKIDASVDWQDFIVLETLEFFSADLSGTSKLSAPLSDKEMRLVRDSGPSATEPLFRSALTGELVPESLYNEHVRTLQIDPTYNKQKETEQERAKSNLDYDNVAENLRRLRQKRAKTSD